MYDNAVDIFKAMDLRGVRELHVFTTYDMHIIMLRINGVMVICTVIDKKPSIDRHVDVFNREKYVIAVTYIETED